MGSGKDRIALCMIQGAEKRGELTKDKIVQAFGAEILILNLHMRN